MYQVYFYMYWSSEGIQLLFKSTYLKSDKKYIQTKEEKMNPTN